MPKLDNLNLGQIVAGAGLGLRELELDAATFCERRGALLKVAVELGVVGPCVENLRQQGRRQFCLSS